MPRYTRLRLALSLSPRLRGESRREGFRLSSFPGAQNFVLHPYHICFSNSLDQYEFIMNGDAVKVLFVIHVKV